MIRTIGISTPRMAKSAIRVYADTSVFGGVRDPLFEEASNVFFDGVREGRFRLVISSVVEEELLGAPAEIKAVYATVASCPVERITPTEETLALRQAYLKAGVVTPRWDVDALHVALATVAECALIISWNFKHIVNFKRIPLYNAVNILNGYRVIEIRSPMEIVET